MYLYLIVECPYLYISYILAMSYVISVHTAFNNRANNFYLNKVKLSVTKCFIRFFGKQKFIADLNNK